MIGVERKAAKDLEGVRFPLFLFQDDEPQPAEFLSC